MCLKTVNSSWRQPNLSSWPPIFFQSIFSLTTGTPFSFCIFCTSGSRSDPVTLWVHSFVIYITWSSFPLSLLVKSLFLFKCLLKFQIANSDKMLDLTMSGLLKKIGPTTRLCSWSLPLFRTPDPKCNKFQSLSYILYVMPLVTAPAFSRMFPFHFKNRKIKWSQVCVFSSTFFFPSIQVLITDSITLLAFISTSNTEIYPHWNFHSNLKILQVISYACILGHLNNI